MDKTSWTYSIHVNLIFPGKPRDTDKEWAWKDNNVACVEQGGGRRGKGRPYHEGGAGGGEEAGHQPRHALVHHPQPALGYSGGLELPGSGSVTV